MEDASPDHYTGAALSTDVSNSVGPYRTLSVRSSENKQSRDSSTSSLDSSNPASILSRSPLPLKLSEAQLQNTLSKSELETLRLELDAAIIFFLESNRPVFLDGLGIFIPKESKVMRTHLLDRWYVLRSERVRNVLLEKCEDLIARCDSRTENLAEVKHIAQRIYPRLPISMQLKWSEADLRPLLRSYIRLLRSNLVRTGINRDLHSVGVLLALHNRRGEKPSDWFASADLLLCPRYTQTLGIEDGHVYERPILENAWECLSAAFGKPVSILKLKGGQQTPGSQHIKVGVFSCASHKRRDSAPHLIYCTQGLLSQTANGKTSAKELVFQLAPASDAFATDTDNIPQWPLKVLGAAWRHMEERADWSLSPGEGFLLEQPLIDCKGCSIEAVISTPFDLIPTEQLTKSGPFVYCNLLGITKDEAQLLSSGNGRLLLAILKSKALDQLTYPQRSSLLRSSTFALTDCDGSQANEAKEVS